MEFQEVVELLVALEPLLLVLPADDELFLCSSSFDDFDADVFLLE